MVIIYLGSGPRISVYEWRQRGRKKGTNNGKTGNRLLLWVKWGFPGNLWDTASNILNYSEGPRSWGIYASTAFSQLRAG